MARGIRELSDECTVSSDVDEEGERDRERHSIKHIAAITKETGSQRQGP
jgi:hypothetical protein